MSNDTIIVETRGGSVWSGSIVRRCSMRSTPR